MLGISTQFIIGLQVLPGSMLAQLWSVPDDWLEAANAPSGTGLLAHDVLVQEFAFCQQHGAERALPC